MTNKKRKTNKLDFSPVAMIMLLILAIMLISSTLSLFGFEAQKAIVTSTQNVNEPYIVEMQLTTIKNIFTVDGFKFMIKNVVLNLGSFQPFINVIIIMIGVGVAEASGYFRALFSKFKKIKLTKITFWVLLISILSTFFGEYNYILLFPIIALLYKHANKNPFLGIVTAFIGMTVGFAAGGLADYNDLLLGIKTQVAANIIGNNVYMVTTSSTIYIMIGTTIFLSLVGTMVMEKFLFHKFDNKGIANEEEDFEVSKKGFLVSNIVFLLMFFGVIYSIIPGYPMSGSLLDTAKSNYLQQLMADGSAFKDGFFFIVASVITIGSLTYGIYSKKIINNHVFTKSLSSGFKNAGQLIVIMFFSAQMVAILNWTNLGEVVAAKLVDMFGTLEFSGLPLVITFILMVALITLILPSTLEKWQVISPIAVPLFMRSNITPDYTQFVFLVSDSIGKLITPLFIYFLIMLGFLEKYKKDDESFSAFGTLGKMMPTILVMVGLLILITLSWYIIGLPIGPGVYPTI